jgi:hypothetical protein
MALDIYSLLCDIVSIPYTQEMFMGKVKAFYASQFVAYSVADDEPDYESPYIPPPPPAVPLITPASATAVPF